MAQTAVLAIDDVLCRGEPRQGARPIDEGLALYHALKLVYRLALVTLHDPALFLAGNGFTDHVIVLQDGNRRGQLTVLRNSGHDVRLYVDADPGMCAYALSVGIACLHFAQPAYLRPEWRPDYQISPRPWDEIDNEVRRQQRLRAKEPSLDE